VSRRAASLLAASASLSLGSGSLYGCEPQPEDGLEVGSETDLDQSSSPPSARERALARLAEASGRARAEADFARIPASDGQLGLDPYRIIALEPAPQGPRYLVLARGRDRALLIDGRGVVLDSAPTPHQPTGVAQLGGELLVVGTGEARVARLRRDGDELEVAGSLDLPRGRSPRDIAARPSSPDRAPESPSVWIVDEGNHRLHTLAGSGSELAEVDSRPHCRGPIRIEAVGGRLLTNCLLEHRLRIEPMDPGGPSGSIGMVIEHDGPMWGFDLSGDLLAITGVEDRPLERRDGGFGYIDSFLFVYRLEVDGPPTLVRSLNLSELGAVTPKWVRWTGPGRLALAGYATDTLLTIDWDPSALRSGATSGDPVITRAAWLPGTHDALPVPTELARSELTRSELGWLGVSPLLDSLVSRAPERPEARALALVVDGVEPDQRSFDEHLGEALVFTTAMAPSNTSEGKRSRFTCETCHFEARVDGRVHFTGRERDGERVHATSKPLLGLFPNPPHFSRALDRSLDVMADNEFGVANRFSADADIRTGWFTLSDTQLPWLALLPGWPGTVDGEGLRSALMAFLRRASMPQNPSTREREHFEPLEAEGAAVFATHCEDCHQARLSTDEPDTRQPFATWESLLFANGGLHNGPITWASDAYAATRILPFVHERGARVPSLRRLHLKWPYFTNGRADTLEAVLVGFRVDPADHDLEPATGPEHGLDTGQRAALLAFLGLL